MLSPRTTEPIKARATRLYFQNFMCILQPHGLGCDAEDCQSRIYIWIACSPIVKAWEYLCQLSPTLKQPLHAAWRGSAAGSVPSGIGTESREGDSRLRSESPAT